MTFAVRQINLQFSNEAGYVVNLDGLRCSAVVTNPGGYSAFGQLQLKVYGMTLTQMNQFSSTGSNMVAVLNNSVTVNAGNEGDNSLPQIFHGNIISSYIDFGSIPEVSFVCVAISAYHAKGKAIQGKQYAGTNRVENIIAALAQIAGLKFYNPTNATAILQDQYLSGSAIDQILCAARNARIPLSIENETVTIWSNTGFRDTVTIDINSNTGLVGYPSYWEAGFNVKSEFKPLITNGRAVNLTSSIPKANGKFPVQSCTHELSTMTPDGPWFTTSQLNQSIYVTNN